MKFKIMIFLILCCNYTNTGWWDAATSFVKDTTGIDVNAAVNTVASTDEGKAVINTINSIDTTASDVQNAIHTVDSYVSAVKKIPTLLAKLNGCLQLTNRAIGENVAKEIGAAFESAFNNLFHGEDKTSIIEGNEGSIIWYISKINQRATEIAAAADEFAAEAAASDGMNAVQFISHIQKASQKIQIILNNFIAITGDLNLIADKISTIVPSWTEFISYTGNDILKTINNPASVHQAGVKCANISTSVTTMTNSYKTQINHMTIRVAQPALKSVSKQITDMLSLIQKPLKQLQNLQGA